jgi:hypothetical protein
MFCEHIDCQSNGRRNELLNVGCKCALKVLPQTAASKMGLASADNWFGKSFFDWRQVAVQTPYLFGHSQSRILPCLACGHAKSGFFRQISMQNPGFDCQAGKPRLILPATFNAA